MRSIANHARAAGAGQLGISRVGYAALAVAVIVPIHCELTVQGHVVLRVHRRVSCDRRSIGNLHLRKAEGAAGALPHSRKPVNRAQELRRTETSSASNYIGRWY